MIKNKKKVGIYVRLSKEDSRSGESVSIENQKLMLCKHIEENGWELTEIYQDDGFSGTNQNRPAFQRMIANVKSGYINTILIKDLSRLGRNYLEVGNLAEVFLPEHGCELISLNEKLDDMMVFRNWFNEQHSKSTSAKVRAGKRASAQNGKHIGAYAPYGYLKEDACRHKLLVDNAAAPIVRNIFQLRASGMSCRAIVVKLNKDNILPPREYYYQCKGSKNPKKTTKLWSDSTVKEILINETYLGTLISGKTGTVSYKNQKQVRKNSNNWIKVENAHEPIIDKQTWDKVQALLEKNLRPRRRNDGKTNLFTGILICNTCSMRLKGQVEQRPRKDGSIYKNVSYMCSTFARSGKNACTSHGITENILITLVVEHIKEKAINVMLDEKKMIDSILTANGSNTYSYNRAYESELAGHLQQIDKLDSLIENLYADKVSGIVPDSLFKRQVVKYENERNERSQAAKALETHLTKTKPNNNASVWTKLIRQHSNIDTLILDYSTIVTLLDKIVVGQTQQINGRRVCDITITYNFASDIKGLNINSPVPKAASQ